MMGRGMKRMVKFLMDIKKTDEKQNEEEAK